MLSIFPIWKSRIFSSLAGTPNLNLLIRIAHISITISIQIWNNLSRAKWFFLDVKYSSSVLGTILVKSPM